MTFAGHSRMIPDAQPGFNCFKEKIPALHEQAAQQ
jgi:hypothetical protein